MSRVSVQCPGCGKSYDVEESWLGRKGRCKKCQTKFVLALSEPDEFVDAAASAAAARDSRVPDETDDHGSIATEAVWTKGQVLLDDFVVERLLGRGGMGVVYLVHSRASSQKFAVKSIRKKLLGDEGHQRNFLAELQTWIDLPAHPHLTACRFFRTVGQEVALFAEFVDGGSLADWIADRRLVRVEQILDIAIQFAWGLHAAHEWGLIHQDVKPGNVLVTQDGVLKVTDFGLARARAVAGTDTRIRGQSILVSSGLMTEAYCSPEQRNGRPLSRKTDIWSWGVSVLEMFTGEVTWPSGTVALASLEDLLLNGANDPRLPRMPDGVAAVLRRCFQDAPSARWANCEALADELLRVFRRLVGQNYTRLAPDLAVKSGQPHVAHDRRTTTGISWDDPREWLVRALQADGRNPAEAEKLLPACRGSPKAQVIADMAAYDEAQRIFERLVAGGRSELESESARLCLHKAHVHKCVDDLPGAVAQDERAIEIYERLVHQEGRHELVGDLAQAVIWRANSLNKLGELTRAQAEARKAAADLQFEITRTGRVDLQAVLNWAKTNLKDLL